MSVETAVKSAPVVLAPIDTRAASLRAVYIIWYRDILRYWRDRWRLVASLAQPLLFLVVFGSGLSSSLGSGSLFGSRGGLSIDGRALNEGICKQLASPDVASRA